ncbi:MAG: hypothetical protein OXI84_06870, partial [bacterium]|nr:hypothetical protein [bacterium]
MCDCLTNEHLCDVDTNLLRLRDFVGLAALLALAAAACGSEEVAVPASVAQADATTTTFAAVEEVSSTAGAVEVAEVGTVVVEGEAPATAEVVEVVLRRLLPPLERWRLRRSGRWLLRGRRPLLLRSWRWLLRRLLPLLL